MVVQVAAGDGQQSSRQSVVGEMPSYVDCQTNIMRLTKQVAQIVQEMVGFGAAGISLLKYSLLKIMSVHVFLLCVNFFTVYVS